MLRTPIKVSRPADAQGEADARPAIPMRAPLRHSLGLFGLLLLLWLVHFVTVAAPATQRVRCQIYAVPRKTPLARMIS